MGQERDRYLREHGIKPMSDMSGKELEEAEANAMRESVRKSLKETGLTPIERALNHIEAERTKKRLIGRSETGTNYKVRAIQGAGQARSLNTGQEKFRYLRLTGVSGIVEGHVWTLTEDEGIIIGRGQEASIKLPDALVGRKDCSIKWSDGVARLVDNHSGNGVFVNGDRIVDRALSDGDEITIGEQVFRVSYVELSPDDERGVPVSSVKEKSPDEIAPILRITVQSGSFKGQEWTFSAFDTISIGRSRDADVCINEPVFSREQCEIENHSGTFVIADKKSGSATFVNGTRVVQKTLNDGDEIEVGNVVLRVSITGGVPSPEAGEEFEPTRKAGEPDGEIETPLDPFPAPGSDLAEVLRTSLARSLPAILPKEAPFGFGFKPEVTYDDDGNELEYALYSECQRGLAICNEGYAGRTQRFDEQGRLLAQAFWDVGGKPMTVNGYFCLTRHYDEHGRLLTKAYFGTDSALRINGDGYAYVTWQYDEHGRVTLESYRGTTQKLVLSNKGYAAMRRKYDEQGYLIEESYWDAEGKLVLNGDGYAFITWQHNANHRANRVYRDTEGKQVVNREGHAVVVCQYDSGARLLEEIYLDANANPTAGQLGYFKKRWEFCDADEAADSAKNQTGWQTMETTLDAGSRPLSVSYFCRDGKPALGKEGYARMVNRCDAKGYVTERSYYDVAGNPTATPYGYASISMRYDKHGNETRHAFYDVSGGRFQKWTYWECERSYDDRGNMTREAFYGVDEERVLMDGYWRWVATFDDKNRELTKTFYGLQDEVLNVVRSTAPLDEGEYPHWTCLFCEEQATEVLRGDWIPIIRKCACGALVLAGFARDLDELVDKARGIFKVSIKEESRGYTRRQMEDFEDAGVLIRDGLPFKAPDTVEFFRWASIWVRRESETL